MSTKLDYICLLVFLLLVGSTPHCHIKLVVTPQAHAQAGVM